MEIIVRSIIMLILTILFSGLLTGVTLQFIGTVSGSTGATGAVFAYIVVIGVPSFLSFGVLFWWIMFRYLSGC